jgi:hypothetical protein
VRTPPHEPRRRHPHDGILKLERTTAQPFPQLFKYSHNGRQCNDHVQVIDSAVESIKIPHKLFERLSALEGVEFEMFAPLGNDKGGEFLIHSLLIGDFSLRDLSSHRRPYLAYFH